MAPKGKPDPKAEAAKGAQPGAPGTLTEKKILLLLACGAVATLSFLTILVMLIMYNTLNENASSIDYPLRNLRRGLTVTINNPDLHTGGAMVVADAVNQLPKNIDDALKDYDSKKKMYQSLFHKAMRTSFGPWKLHGRSLYYFAKGRKTWYDAESFCISRDAHLASVLNDEEQNFITSQSEEASWIGLMDENKKGVWRWTDGSRLLHQYWSVGEPSNTERAGESDHACTVMVPSSTNHNWNNVNCHKLYGWVCKERLDSE